MDKVVEMLYYVLLFILCTITCYSFWMMEQDFARKEINRGINFLKNKNGAKKSDAKNKEKP